MATGLSLVAGGGLPRPPGRPVERPIPSGLGERWILPRPPRPTLSELFAATRAMAAGPGSCSPSWRRASHCCGCRSGWRSSRAGGSIRRGLGLVDLIHVEARDARVALWAMEEGLRCGALGAVIGELWGDPASARLHRDAAARGRGGAARRAAGWCGWAATANLSGARMRWRVASAPSLANPLDPRAPGAPAWDAELFRARGRAAGAVERRRMTRVANPFHLVAAPGDRAVARRASDVAPDAPSR